MEYYWINWVLKDVGTVVGTQHMTKCNNFVHVQLKKNIVMHCSCQPGDDVAIDLQKLEEFLGLLSVSVLLFSCQGVIGNQQWVGPSSWKQWNS